MLWEFAGGLFPSMAHLNEGRASIILQSAVVWIRHVPLRTQALRQLVYFGTLILAKGMEGNWREINGGNWGTC